MSDPNQPQTNNNSTTSSSTDVHMSDASEATSLDDQSNKRQRTQENAPSNGTTTTAAAAAAPSSSSTSSSTTTTTRKLTPTQSEEIRLNLVRYSHMVSKGCGNASCTNHSTCVSAGAKPLAGMEAINKARDLYTSKKPCCIPLPATSSSTTTTPSAVTSASTSSTHSVGPSSTTSATPIRPSESQSTPATTSTATPQMSTGPMSIAIAPVLPQPTPLAASPSSAFVTPARPQFGASSAAAGQVPQFPPLAAHGRAQGSSLLSAILSGMSPAPRINLNTPSTSASPPLPSSAAAASSSSSLSASPSLSPQLAPVKAASPSLTQMLASVRPTLPVTSKEPPITDIQEWIDSVNAARVEWESRGSPTGDLTAFRPLIQRIYRVFNDLNCLNLSFRIRKDEEDRTNEQTKLKELEKIKSEAETQLTEASLASTTTTTSAPESKDDVEAAMTDIPTAISTTVTLTPLTLPSNPNQAVTDATQALTDLRASIASEFVEPTEFSPAIDYESLDAFYESISSIVFTKADGTEERPLLGPLLNGLHALLTELTFRPIATIPMHPAFLRCVPILYENCALWFDPSSYEHLKLLCKFVSILPRTAKKLIISWMSDVDRWTPEPRVISPAHAKRMYSIDRMERLLGALQQFISVRIYDKENLNDVVPAVVFISCIHEANEGFAEAYRHIPISVPKVSRRPIALAPQLFYNDAVNECADLKQDFRRWMQQVHSGRERSTDFSFFKYNFILDAGSKANLLRYDAQVQQHNVYRDSMLSSGMDQRQGYLILEVRRSNVVADTMRALANKKPEEYKKPLKIHFHGEKGIDAGGLRKEFFQLIIGELFDARFGMFLVDEETRTFKFNPDSLDSPLEFELIGVLLGIAIYNSTILDLHIPQVYYKKLLGLKPTLDDLLESQPSLAKGLLQLLEFDGDVEATFARDFTISYESYGEQKVVELKPNGANIPLTNENRHEYVDLYVEWVLEKSIAKQFGAFNKGFHRACGGEALKLFRPFELELLVCGTSELDFDALESTTRYEDGYTKDSNIIKQFWEIVHQDLTLEDKKRLLEFATGSDRVPIRGLSSMHLTISKQGSDSEQLPTSHTCFHHMLLPDYGSKEKLKTKLLLALKHSKGFGLI